MVPQCCSKHLFMLTIVLSGSGTLHATLRNRITPGVTYSTRNLGLFCRRLGYGKPRPLANYSCNYFPSNATWCVNITDGRTDVRTTYGGNTAFCMAGFALNCGIISSCSCQSAAATEIVKGYISNYIFALGVLGE